ncbi:Transmembrane protein [Paragonimus heterotremus]|uniref:GDT1 family protein n=1 Tax=Paragonimus heterotremus TaxID=100268 RepID=A0A8J4WV16_9TREM|nr:Transmembrane protein [Paragonimus heterotremus]
MLSHISLISCVLILGHLRFSLCGVPEDSVPNQPSVQIDTEHFHFMDSFLRGLSASLYVIIISELGDKTFFIAAIMAMQHPRCLVYAGAMGALATMTILSGISCLALIPIPTHTAILGYATTIIPRSFTFYCSGVLFLVFGLKMLYDAYTMSPTDTQEEYEEVKSQLAQSSVDVETGKADPPSSRFYLRGRLRDAVKRILSPVLAEAFVLTFLAEWGDRSQLTTIVLAATKVRYFEFVLVNVLVCCF